MTHSRSLMAALVLTLGAAACDAEPFAPADTTLSGDALDLLLADAGQAARAGGSGGVALFDALAAEIPGFGGLFRTGQCAVVAVLTSDADRESALAIVRRMLLPIVGRTCGRSLTIGAQEGQFTYLDLTRYFSAAAPLGAVAGVHTLYIQFSVNRIVVEVASRSVAERVLGRLDELGIPHDAVVIRITGRR